jgi:hypothetical protein
VYTAGIASSLQTFLNALSHWFLSWPNICTFEIVRAESMGLMKLYPIEKTQGATEKNQM